MRNYTVKYKSGGVETLNDNRGKRKSESEMSELGKYHEELIINGCIEKFLKTKV